MNPPALPRLNLTLRLASGPAEIWAYVLSVPGLVLHEETFRGENGVLRQNPGVRHITHQRSVGVVGVRLLSAPESWEETAAQVAECYGHLDWTVPAETLVRDRRYHDAAFRFEVGGTRAPAQLVTHNIRAFEQGVARGLIRD